MPSTLLVFQIHTYKFSILTSSYALLSLMDREGSLIKLFLLKHDKIAHKKFIVM